MDLKTFSKYKKSESGIDLDKELKIKSIVSDNLPIYVRIMQIVLIILAVICPIFSFLQGFKFKLNYLLIISVLCVCVVIEYIAYRILKLYEQSLPSMLVVLSYCIFLVAMYKRITSGFLKIVEEYITYFNFNYNTDYILNIKVEKEALNNATWLVLIICLFVSLVMSYLVVVEISKFIYLCITILWPILCYMVGAKPNFFFFILYILVTIVIFGMNSISKNYEISDEIHGASKRQNMFKDLAMIRIGITIGVFVLCIFVIFYAVFSKNRYENSEVLKNISANLRSTLQGITSTESNQVDAFDRGESEQTSIVISDMITKKSVINNGLIADSGNVRFYNKNVFRIVSNEIMDTLYLKEYVGLRYDNGWICDKDEGDNKKLSQLDNQLRDTLIKNTGKNVKQEIPYSMVSIIKKESDIKGDLIPTGANVSYEMKKNGTVKYKEEYKNVVAGYEFEFATLYNLRDKIRYNTDAYNKTATLNSYKEVPETLKEAILTIKPDIDKYIEKINNMEAGVKYVRNNDKYNIIRALVEYFNMNYKYTLNPGKPANDVDPIEFFLLENKKGYCMYYAAAATAILRYYGIPTRYVEGYVVRSKDCESAKRINTEKYFKKLKIYDKSYAALSVAPLYEYNVKDNNGHAWVEVYIDGIGWVPVEVTSSQLSESRDHSELEEALEEKEEVPSFTNEPVTTMEPLQSSKEPVVQTMEPTQISTPEPKKDKNKVDDKKDTVFSIIIVVILLTSIVLILCIKNGKISSSVDKNKKLYNTNKMEYVRKMISVILSKFDIVFNSEVTYEEFAKIIVDKFPEYSFDKIDTIIRFILKDSYSENGITDDEQKQIIDFYNFIVDKYDEKIKTTNKAKKINNDKKREAYIRKV